MSHTVPDGDVGGEDAVGRSAVRDLSDVTYILASLFFILSLSGLSKHETATRGNMYGVVAMALAMVVTLFDPAFGHPLAFALALAPGFALGAFLALRVQMTSMPQLVALLHSFVGMAAVLVGVANAVSDEPGRYMASPLLHKIEIFLGVFIGSVTVTGSLVAAGKLHELLRSAPLVLGGRNVVRHGFNITIVLLCLLLGWRYCDDLDSYRTGMEELLAMVVLAGALGWHLVMVRSTRSRFCSSPHSLPSHPRHRRAGTRSQRSHRSPRVCVRPVTGHRWSGHACRGVDAQLLLRMGHSRVGLHVGGQRRHTRSSLTPHSCASR